jgi:tRNA-2-methylthio-N6-dimethylallyladenosine synthase
MGGIVSEAVKDQRLQELQKLLFDQQHAFNETFVGKIVPILFDRKGQKEGQLLGKTPWMQSVYVDANERLFGHTVDVRIERAHQNGMAGAIVTTEINSTPSKREAA